MRLTILLLLSGCVFAVEGLAAGLLKGQVFLFRGEPRTYDLYLPENHAQQPNPLVLLLHGHGGSAEAITGENNRKSPYKIWLDVAEREGWIVLIPDGALGSDNKRGWNDCRANAKTNPPVDDVVFLDQLVDSLSTQYSVDKQRLYAHGTSNGGNMVFRLAQERGDKYRAVAAVVAAMPEENQCSPPVAAISVLIMNGTEDPILPYQGGPVGIRESDKVERGSVLSTAASLQYWLVANQIIAKPVIADLPNRSRRDKSTVHTQQYVNEENQTEVILYEVRGGGHTEPSLSEHYRKLYTLIVGRQNKDIEMVDEVWKFFERHP